VHALDSRCQNILRDVFLSRGPLVALYQQAVLRVRMNTFDPVSSQLSLSPPLALLSDLVRINSVNPAYEGGRPESGMVNYLREYFARHSIETWQQRRFLGART
jgi:hypothetical protein